jgi:LPS sulfotransferase NodH
LLATGSAGRPEEYFRPDWYRRFCATDRVEYQHRLHRLDLWPDGAIAGPEYDDLFEIEPHHRFRDFLAAVPVIGTTDNGVFAIKLHRHQLNRAVQLLRRTEPGLTDLQLLTTWLPEIRFVFLRRRDQIRRAVSHYRAMKSDVWWLTAGAEPAAQIASVDFDEIERLRRLSARHELEWRAFFRGAGVTPVEVCYEDLATDVHSAVTRVLRSLEVDEVGVDTNGHPRLVRQADNWTDYVVHEYVTWRRSRVALRSRTYGADYEA